MTTTLDPVTTEILWTRLVGLVDEAAAAFVRTAFSTVVRDSNDYAVIVTDVEGRSLAQSSLSIPSFIGTLPATVRHFLAQFPLDTLRPGDAMITNDPWLATGHLPDISMAVPIFRGGEPIAFAAAVSHLPDIGGRMWNTGIRELYEEGLQLPPIKLMHAGEPDPTVVAIIERNVRVPDQTMGDVWGQLAACRQVGDGLLRLVAETGADVAALGEAIWQRSERATRDAIARVPPGEYVGEAIGDGFEEPIHIRCRVHVRADSIHVDYAGSSQQIPRAVNVVPGYTFAYTAFCLKTLLAPGIPNNDGTTRALTVSAPLGSILNPRYPAPCSARGMTGQLMVPAIMQALGDTLPDRVQAAPGSPQCSFTLTGSERGRGFASVNFVAGGMGASARGAGLDAVSFPSNVANTPIEVIESNAPLRIECRELRRASGGAGLHRGGDGQRQEIVYTGAGEALASFIVSRLRVAAPGLAGGAPGRTARLTLNGAAIDPASHLVVRGGDRLVVETAGGGGFGVEPRHGAPA